jgi:sphinganine-1-phosphate aldolase
MAQQRPSMLLARTWLRSFITFQNAKDVSFPLCSHANPVLTYNTPMSSLSVRLLVRIPRARFPQHTSHSRRLFVYRLLIRGFRHLRSRGLTTTVYELYASLAQVRRFLSSVAVQHLLTVACFGQRIFRLVLLAPPAKHKLEQELKRVSIDIRSRVAPFYPDLQRHVSLPQSGRDKDWIEKELEKLRKIGEGQWEAGRVSGAVYHGGDDLSMVIRDCMTSVALTSL